MIRVWPDTRLQPLLTKCSVAVDAELLAAAAVVIHRGPELVGRNNGV